MENESFRREPSRSRLDSEELEAINKNWDAGVESKVIFIGRGQVMMIRCERLFSFRVLTRSWTNSVGNASDDACARTVRANERDGNLCYFYPLRLFHDEVISSKLLSLQLDSWRQCNWSVMRKCFPAIAKRDVSSRFLEGASRAAQLYDLQGEFVVNEQVETITCRTTVWSWAFDSHFVRLTRTVVEWALRFHARDNIRLHCRRHLWANWFIIFDVHGDCEFLFGSSGPKNEKNRISMVT